MDNGLSRDGTAADEFRKHGVLILIVMDNGLSQIMAYRDEMLFGVLILIVMDNGLSRLHPES